MKARLLIILIALAAAAAGHALAQEKDLDESIRSKEDELQKLRREISEQRRKISEIEEQEKDVSDYISRLNKEERLMKKLLEGLEDKESMLEEQAASLRRDLETSEMVYAHRLEIFSKRLREIYKDGPRHVWQELLTAEDFPDLLQKYKFLSLIAEGDAAMIADVRERKASIETQEAEITEILQEVSASRSEKQTELRRLDETCRPARPRRSAGLRSWRSGRRRCRTLSPGSSARGWRASRNGAITARATSPRSREGSTGRSAERSPGSSAGSGIPSTGL
jgi:peptidoglycan hydrolase CwlO-like protein